MNTTHSIEDIIAELAGIKDNLFLLSAQFEGQARDCRFSNETIGGTLASIALHLERVCEDLDNIE